MFGARQQHVGAVGALQKSNAAVRIVAHEGDDDNRALLALEAGGRGGGVGGGGGERGGRVEYYLEGEGIANEEKERKREQAQLRAKGEK